MIPYFRVTNPGNVLTLRNGLANSRFHTLLFGINRLHSDGMPCFGANDPRSAAIVQLLCNQNFNGLNNRRSSQGNA